jgi:hypothetical protein
LDFETPCSFSLGFQTAPVIRSVTTPHGNGIPSDTPVHNIRVPTNDQPLKVLEVKLYFCSSHPSSFTEKENRFASFLFTFMVAFPVPISSLW